MIRNYLKIAWRNLSKNKVYSFINITGLAVGMAVALLIGLWIWDELSFNDYHQNHARLAQVRDIQIQNGSSMSSGGVDMPVEQELMNRFPGDFKRLAFFSGSTNFHTVAVGTKKLKRSAIFVEPAFPEMLTLHMLEGTRSALKDPSSLLLTASMAHDLFGDSDPMNRTIRLDSIDMKVGGVFEDLPANTTFGEANFLAPWDKYLNANLWIKNTQTRWGMHFVALLAEMNDHAGSGDHAGSADHGGSADHASSADHDGFDATTAKIRYIPREHLKEGQEELFLFPMDRWHLYHEFHDGRMSAGRIQFVWLFGIIGIFVLLLACINFMNLSTARSERRAKEVGIRKAIGSLRGQLIGQFLGESLLVAFLSFILALILVQVSLPFFDQLAAKQMLIPWSKPLFWLLLLGFTLFTGLVSGSYPAFYLSGFDAIRVLKGTFRAGRFASLPRPILVVVQFTVSIALIIGTIIVFRQIEFARNRPVGYSRAGLVTVNIQTAPGIKFPWWHYDAVHAELMRTGAIENMTESSGPETDIWGSDAGFDWPGKDPQVKPTFGVIAVTHEYGPTIGWQILKGRDFSKTFSMDSAGLILNEAAVKLTGLKDPVGMTFQWQGHPRQVIGVVKDMVMASPYRSAEPTIFFMDYTWNNYVTMRVRPQLSMHDALARLEPVFKKYDPGNMFNVEIADDEYARKFTAEERIGNLAGFFSSFAILISCLGLFGLASFVAEQRTKEIGVRKVLGASVFDLWKTLSAEFVALVVISCLIAIPIASHFLGEWLQRYEYRTTISWWIFAVAGAGALLITLLTVSHQIIRAALMNPVNSLRTE